MFQDIKNDWQYFDASGNSTASLQSSATGTVNGPAWDMENAHFLTNALITVYGPVGTDSPAFSLQESDDTVSGNFTAIADTNASATMTTGAGILVLTGQRKKKYCRIHVVPSTASDTVNCIGFLLGFSKMSPLGASGVSRSPAS